MSNPAAGVFFESPADTGDGARGSSVNEGGKRKMSEADVQSAVYKMVTEAIQYVDQELSPKRALATNYYQGLPFGNEQAGRSQVVSTDLRDAVRSIIPSLMRIFFGAERVVEYEPRKPTEVEQADQATAFISDVICQLDNPGFTEMYSWLKDALVKNIGIVKSWYHDVPEVQDRTLTYIPMDQIVALHADPSIEVQSITPCEGQPPGANLYDVEYRKTLRQGRVIWRCLPPEEFLFTRGARMIDADAAQPGVALLAAHRTQMTKSQLLEIGVKEADIEEYGYKDMQLDANLEEIARQRIVKPDTSAMGPVPTQPVLYIEAYPYLDVDGDGIAELRKVCCLGPSYHVISDEPWDDRPFSVLCPDPEPHTIIGQGIGDYTMDLQRINSALQRSMLDSLALSVNPRVAYDEASVSQADILNTAIGAPIRTQGMPASVIQEFTHTFVGEAVLAVLQYFEAVKESRIKVTRASAGLDADTLQSTTKAAVSATFTQAQQHIELMARIFAETGVRHLFRRLYKLAVENPDPERMMKFRGSYVPVDPTHWPPDLNVRVNVAIGAGLDDEKYAVLQNVAEDQMAIVQAFGLNQPLVTPQAMREVRVKMLQLRGRQDAESFYPPVPQNWQPQPPPPSPEAQVAQAEALKAQGIVQKHQADAQLASQKHQDDTALKQQDLDLRREQMLLEDQRERQRLAQESALREAEIATRHQAAMTHTGAQLELGHEKVAADVAKTAHATVVESHKAATEAIGETLTPAEPKTESAPKKPRKPK